MVNQLGASLQFKVAYPGWWRQCFCVRAGIASWAPRRHRCRQPAILVHALLWKIRVRVSAHSSRPLDRGRAAMATMAMLVTLAAPLALESGPVIKPRPVRAIQYILGPTLSPSTGGTPEGV